MVLPARLPGLSALMLCLVLSACGGAPVRPGDEVLPADGELVSWVDGELAPYLAEQLARHPRFKGEPVLLVSMDGADVRPDIDELTGSIRARLMDALLSTPGINLVWRPATRPWQHDRGPAELRCQDNTEVHYYIGLQIAKLPGGGYRLTVRALDLQDNAWVTGFGRQWEGRLNRAQRLALAHHHPDAYLRGLRVLPFTEAEIDLLATYLAHNLSCQLRGHGGENVAVYPAIPDAGPSTLVTTLELVGNQLARMQAVQVADAPARANHTLKGKMHPIHGGLHQVWMTLRPEGDEGGNGSLGTAAYLQLGAAGSRPGQQVASIAPIRTEAVTSPRPMLSAIRLVKPRDPSLCASVTPWRRGRKAFYPSEAVSPGECFAMELDVREAAQVFLLGHRMDGALVRLMPTACRRAGLSSAQARAGETLRYPSKAGGAGQVMPWSGEAGLETYYAIAVNGPVATRAFKAHLGELPAYCDAGAEDQLSPGDMERWLAGLDGLVADYGEGIDWQAVRVRHGH